MKNNTLGIILRTAREKMVLSLVIIATVILAIIFALLPPMVLGQLVDDLADGQSLSLSMALVYFALVALTGLTESAREGALTVFGQKITHAMRSSLMDKYLRLKAQTLQDYQPGQVVSRFVGDVDMVENLFTSGVVSMFADACKILSILVIIWFSNRGLTLLLIILLPFIYAFTRHVQKRMLAAQLKNRDAVSRVSGHVPQTLKNIRTIHNLGKESYMADCYQRYIQDSYKAMEKTNFYDAVYSPVILILNALVVAIVMALSASGNSRILAFFAMTPGTAVAVINFISQIFTPVESLGMEIQTIQSAMAGLQRIDEFLALEEDVKEEVPLSEKRREVAGENQAFVELRDVTFGYDNHLVLEHLNIKIYQGQQVTLQGRTGAGKSTIFKLLLGLYQPNEGQVLIGSKPVRTIKEADRRQLYGYVEQSFHRVPGTIADQISLFDDGISQMQIKEAAKLVGLHDTIMALPSGYDTRCTDGIFSQGQWQLLSIARAVVTNPKLLLLDEITADLDKATEEQVLAALQKASQNRTLISISHRTSAMTGQIIQI